MRKVAIISLLAIFLSNAVNAEQMPEKEFYETVNFYNILLEQRESALHQAIENQDEPERIVDRLCLVAGTYEGLQKLGYTNMHIENALMLIDRSHKEINHYRETLTQLGENYAERCHKFR